MKDKPRNINYWIMEKWLEYQISSENLREYMGKYVIVVKAVKPKHDRP